MARPPARPGAEEYLFVVEGAGGQLLGTSAIAARVGGFDPFYTYEIRAERVSHPPLGVDRTIEVLHLQREHKGPSELCGLVVAPTARGRGIGRLASLGRLAFVAAHPERFDDRMIAEIRGYQDAAGRSPFWDAVGRVFLAPSEFAEADMLTGLGEKDFVADLMPRHPIYLDLLPAPVRDVIGRPHDAAVPAMRILEAEGFARAREVDIFDAGPILECATASIRTVREAGRVRVARVGEQPAGPVSLLATTEPAPYRAVAARVEHLGDGEAAIGRAVADALGAEPGAELLVAVMTSPDG